MNDLIMKMVIWLWKWSFKVSKIDTLIFLSPLQNIFKSCKQTTDGDIYSWKGGKCVFLLNLITMPPKGKTKVVACCHFDLKGPKHDRKIPFVRDRTLFEETSLFFSMNVPRFRRATGALKFLLAEIRWYSLYCFPLLPQIFAACSVVHHHWTPFWD